MNVTKTSLLSGITRTKTIDISEKDYTEWTLYKRTFEDLAGNLTPEEREFLITGATPDEWEEYTAVDTND